MYHWLYTANVTTYETKLLFECNLLIETRLQRYLCTFDISFFLISEMEKHDREKEKERIEIAYIYIET